MNNWSNLNSCCFDMSFTLHTVPQIICITAWPSWHRCIGTVYCTLCTVCLITGPDICKQKPDIVILYIGSRTDWLWFLYWDPHYFWVRAWYYCNCTFLPGQWTIVTETTVSCNCIGWLGGVGVVVPERGWRMCIVYLYYIGNGGGGGCTPATKHPNILSLLRIIIMLSIPYYSPHALAWIWGV